MTQKQKAVYDKIVERWKTKRRGTYINRKIAKSAHALVETGDIVLFPYTPDYGWEAFPAGAK
jgi:hypothetical protein